MIKAKVKTKFISKDKLQEKLDRQQERVLFKTGDYARKIIRNRVRRRAPRTRTKSGALRKRRRTKYPAHHHPSDDGGLRAVRFDVDLTKKDVIVGPIRFYDVGKMPFRPNGTVVGLPGAHVWVEPTSGRTVPALLNFGGQARMHVAYLQSGQAPFSKSVFYQPQPFVSDALPKAQKRMAQIIAQNQLRP